MFSNELRQRRVKRHHRGSGRQFLSLDNAYVSAIIVLRQTLRICGRTSLGANAVMYAC